MTLTEQKRTDDGKIALNVSIDGEAFGKALEKEYQKQKGRISIQGFRRGKAPRTIIERMYGENFFYEDAINGMLQGALEFALEESGAEIIGRPEVSVENADRRDGVSLSFSALLRPELAVSEYKGLTAKRHVHPVEDEDIENELLSMRERGSRLVTVEGRPAETGDIAVIDFEGFEGGEAFEGGKGENHSLTLGSGQFIPGFEEQVAGHSAGDGFEVNVTFPEDYSAERLAGKEAVFKVKLHEIRKKELPEPDDEFAKDVSECDTIGELKADIRARLQKDRDESAERDVENQLGDRLAVNLVGEVPEVMIEERIDEMIRDFSYRMSARGLSLDDYLRYSGQGSADFRGGFRENAINQVKVRLALEAVVRAEGITVSDGDVEAEWAKMAESYGTDAEKIREIIPESELRKDLAANRALDFVKRSAEITEDVHSIHEHDETDGREDGAAAAETAGQEASSAEQPS